MKKIRLILAYFAVLLVVMMPLAPTYAESLPKLITPVATTDSVFGQSQYYSVIFDGEGEAAVNAKLNLENIDIDKNIDKFMVEIPGNDVRMIKAIQEISAQSRQCRRWEPIPMPMDYEEGSITMPQSISQQCIEWYPDASGPRYYTLKFEKEQLSKSVQFTFNLPEPVLPQETISILLYYKASGYVQEKMGISYFNYETLKVPYDVESVRVAINVQEGLYLEGGEAKTDYLPSSTTYSLQKAPLALEGVQDVAISNFSRDIQYVPGYTKSTSGLDPLESFIVEGKYAKSQFALEKWFIIGVVIIFVFVLGGIIVFVRWDLKKTKALSKKR
ncbi:hypothetical protein D4R86_03520 [bacterium]|nr:MAG: hypothetical protein D4R86_03520 [bacterium]